ncbi:nucleotidyl transferase AbiEii/AbiGii toxin family protein [Eggerthella timonensis]|uniref:nucleotidyl transferase AbiEii/AbiGii toxin family protein n=1 Tax=Eggerthella timonensis TaxID=1871008 RepID=UPI000C767D17|nr:nucleotidyl transferase AbiEii/AbiGii toxin family protein [Eggerthella timonensis]
MKKKPSSMRHLDDAIRRACGGSPEEYVRMRTLVANVVVSQMLPDGVVKGGSALKMRFGNAATRFTTDLDTATATDPGVYAEKLAATLAKGWEGFTGRVMPRDPAHPQGVPQEYVMRPFDVKLSYNGKPWCTVPLEVGYNEIGDAEAADWVETEDAAGALVEMGFPAPGKVPLMPLVHQVAQKIHAVTGGGDRVRDLVDLQLISANAELDLAEIRRTCARLFAYRKAQTWPPVVAKGEGWDALYAAQAADLPVKPGIDEAVAWANDLIERIESAGR